MCSFVLLKATPTFFFYSLKTKTLSFFLFSLRFWHSVVECEAHFQKSELLQVLPCPLCREKKRSLFSVFFRRRTFEKRIKTNHQYNCNLFRLEPGFFEAAAAYDKIRRSYCFLVLRVFSSTTLDFPSLTSGGKNMAVRTNESVLLEFLFHIQHAELRAFN